MIPLYFWVSPYFDLHMSGSSLYSVPYLLYGELAVAEIPLGSPQFLLDLYLCDLKLLGAGHQGLDVALDLGDVDPSHRVILLKFVRACPAKL